MIVSKSAMRRSRNSVCALRCPVRNETHTSPNLHVTHTAPLFPEILCEAELSVVIKPVCERSAIGKV
jgi:hypothetical protein